MGNGAITFSPDSNVIASEVGKTILLWDITSYPIMSISTDSVDSLTIGEELTFDVNITNGENIFGYQATIRFDPDALEYVETKYGDYLSGAVPIQPISRQHEGRVQLASLSLTGTSSHGDGLLATLKFKVKGNKNSKLWLQDVILSDPEGNKSYAWLDSVQLLKSVISEDDKTITCPNTINEDVNQDCVVNIKDLVLVATHFGGHGSKASDVNDDDIVNIIDLVLVAAAFGETTAGAPTHYVDGQDIVSVSNVQHWLQESQKVSMADPAFQRGIVNLQNLLSVLMPKQTLLLANYPNPFNPETWIPYQLAEPANVSVYIHSANGKLVRNLALGNQVTGRYQDRNRAAYWDGNNENGESVASGVYFYTLTAGEFSATRKMLILK